MYMRALFLGMTLFVATASIGADEVARARALLEGGKAAEALQTVDAALARMTPGDPRQSAAQLVRGRALAASGKPSSAAQVFFALFRDRPRSAEAGPGLVELAGVRIQLDKPQDACKALREASELYSGQLPARSVSLLRVHNRTAGCDAPAPVARVAPVTMTMYDRTKGLLGVQLAKTGKLGPLLLCDALEKEPLSESQRDKLHDGHLLVLAGIADRTGAIRRSEIETARAEFIAAALPDIESAYSGAVSLISSVPRGEWQQIFDRMGCRDTIVTSSGYMN